MMKEFYIQRETHTPPYLVLHSRPCPAFQDTLGLSVTLPRHLSTGCLCRQPSVLRAAILLPKLFVFPESPFLPLLRPCRY